MAVTDLHTIDISTPIDKLFSTSGSATKGAILSVIEETPQINVGDNTPLVIAGRAKGSLKHEGDKKVDNGRVVKPMPFTTAKLVYSQRVTDEFLKWDAARQGDFVSRWIADITAKSVPRDIDTVVIGGIDPFTGTVDPNLSDYLLKTGSAIKTPNTGVTAAAMDTDFGSAVKAVQEKGYDVTGSILSGDAALKLATITEGNTKKYPELGVFGLSGGTLSGRPAGSTAEVAGAGAEIIVGDFSQLLLGFAGQATWTTIQYGDPDNSGVDLAGSNQVMIRLELMFGFRNMDANAISVVPVAAA